MHAAAALGRNDLRVIRRDSLLITVVLGPLVYMTLVRLAVPPLTHHLDKAYGFDLVPYYPLVVSAFAVLGPALLIGAVTGLLILDERDAGTLTALRVTPVRLAAYAGYRAATAVLLTAGYVLLTMGGSGLVAPSVVLRAVPIALVAGLVATVVATLLPAFAGNKVEGLAVVRAIGLVFMALPLVPWFLRSGWEPLFGLLPSYWPAKAFWLASAGQPMWPHLLAGAAFDLVLAWLLVRRFARKRL